MWATSKTHATQWNLPQQILTTLDVLWKGSSLVWYLSICHAQVAKAVQHCPIPGLYSGIFVMYLRHCCGSQRSDRENNIIFYALWVLYASITALIIVDTLSFCWVYAVSMHDHCSLTLFQLIIQNIEIQYQLQIIDVTAFACSDFIAQMILVRPTGNAYYYSSNFSKDISLLDCLGLQHSYCDCSVILSIRILRYINLSLFTVWSYSMVSSNMYSGRYCPSVLCTRPISLSWVDCHSGHSGSRPVHDCECSHDSINRFQDLQGVPES